MADIRWSTLFPKTGGSGRGGAFTGKVLTPAMSPYPVSAWDRLIVTQTDQPIIIDPSGLKDDEAFQLVDASRNFDKNPVTIKGDKLAIQIVGAGNDLILDMIGAGNLWEFIATGGQLLVADSPGYTGDLPAGGAPATGGGADLSNVPIFEFGEGDPLNSAHPNGGGDRDLVYISMGVPENVAVEAGMWRWPAGVPADNTGGKQWQKILFTTDDELAVNLAARPIWLRGEQDPTGVDDTKGLAGGPSEVYYINVTTGKVFAWPGNRPYKDENPVPNLWTPLHIGGSGGDIFTVKEIAANEGSDQNTPVMAYTANPGELVRVSFLQFSSSNVEVTIPAVDRQNLKPIRVVWDGQKPPVAGSVSESVKVIIKSGGSKILGTWDGYDPTGDSQLEMDDPGEYIELTPYVVSNGTIWLITGAAYTEIDADMSEAKGDVTAKPGQILMLRVSGNVTMPAPDINDPAPITLINAPAYLGMPITTDNQITVKTGGQKLAGVFRNKSYYMTGEDIVLSKNGEWVRFEPCGGGEATGVFWLISGSGIVS